MAQYLLIPLVLIRMPLLTKNLTTQEYGLWGLLNATQGLTVPFTSLGLGIAMSRFLASEKKMDEVQEGFYSVLSIRLFLSLIIALTVLLFASPIASHFFDGAVEIVRISAFIIILATLNPIYLRLVKIFRLVKMRSIIKIIDGYGSVGLYAVLLLTGHGLLSIIVAALALKITIITFLIFFVGLKIGFKRPNFSRIKEYLRYGLPYLPASMGFWLVNLTDRYIIAYFLGAASVGIYSAPYAIGQMPYMFAGLINYIILIAISQLYDSGKIDEVKKHLSYALKYFLAITIPFVFGTAVLSEQVLNILSTSEIANQGWFVTPLVASGHLFLGVYNIMLFILLVTKKTKILPLIWLISAPLNLGLNVVVVPYLGIIGAAITTLIAYIVATSMVSYFALKEFTINANWSFILKSLLASTMMSLVLLYIAPQGAVYTILTIVAGVLIYSVVLILLKGFSKTEFEFFKGLLKNSFKKKSIRGNG